MTREELRSLESAVDEFLSAAYDSTKRLADEVIQQMDLAEQNIQFSDYKAMSHVELRRRRLLIDGGKK